MSKLFLTIQFITKIRLLLLQIKPVTFTKAHVLHTICFTVKSTVNQKYVTFHTFFFTLTYQDLCVTSSKSKSFYYFMAMCLEIFENNSSKLVKIYV